MVENVTNKWSTWDACTMSEKLINLHDDPLIVPLIYLYMTYGGGVNKFVLYCSLIFSHYDGYRLNLTNTLNLGAAIMSTLVFFLHTSMLTLAMLQCSQVGDGIRASMSGK